MLYRQTNTYKLVRLYNTLRSYQYMHITYKDFMKTIAFYVLLSILPLDKDIHRRAYYGYALLMLFLQTMYNVFTSRVSLLYVAQHKDKQAAQGFRVKEGMGYHARSTRTTQ